MEITSVNNELVKEYSKLQQKKYRNSTNKFLLEGYKAIKEAYDFGIKIERIFVTKNKIKEYKFPNELLVESSDSVLKKLSTTESVPEFVAIGIQKKYSLDILNNCKKVILLENIKDAGNLGTIIRSSVAFNTDAVILYGDCVDIYNPKCVRSAVGNLWKIPVFHFDKMNDLEKYFGKFSRIATLPKSNNYLKQFHHKLPVLVMFGSEADGLSPELISYSTESVKIEMNKDVESLNLATSVAVVEYELFT